VFLLVELNNYWNILSEKMIAEETAHMFGLLFNLRRIQFLSKHLYQRQV